jgi:hypothetical protein
MIVMYLITQEDTAATLIGSILAVIGVTIGLGLALLAWEISLDVVWLRLCFLVAFLFGGLFLKRVLTIGALGSAIGLPAALVMILPDISPQAPKCWSSSCSGSGGASRLDCRLISACNSYYRGEIHSRCCKGIWPRGLIRLRRRCADSPDNASLCPNAIR